MNDWIEWKGGDCPVDLGTMVQVEVSRGRNAVLGQAGSFEGEYDGDECWWKTGRILRYRVMGLSKANGDKDE